MRNHVGFESGPGSIHFKRLLGDGWDARNRRFGVLLGESKAFVAQLHLVALRRTIP